jgi:hypothetical protein
VTRAACVYVCLLRAQQAPDGAQLSCSATLAALVARQAIAGLTPTVHVQAPPVSEARSTVTQGSTRTTRPGAFGTVPPAVSTITQTRPTPPTTTRSRCAPVRPDPARPLNALRRWRSTEGVFCVSNTRVCKHTHARTQACTQYTHALTQTRAHARARACTLECTLARMLARTHTRTPARTWVQAHKARTHAKARIR